MNNTEDQMLPAELRAIAAMLAMQGLLAGEFWTGPVWTDTEQLAARTAKLSVELADALLARLAQ